MPFRQSLYSMVDAITYNVKSPKQPKTDCMRAIERAFLVVFKVAIGLIYAPFL